MGERELRRKEGREVIGGGEGLRNDLGEGGRGRASEETGEGARDFWIKR